MEKFFQSVETAPQLIQNVIRKSTNNLQFTFRKYQETAFIFLWMKALQGHGCLLPLEMGLGKTLIAVAYMYSIVMKLIDLPASAITKNPIFLVVAPVTILNDVWEMECLKVFAKEKIVVYHGVNRPKLEQLESCSVIITSIETLHSEYEHHCRDSGLLQLKIHTLIVDEGHVIRNGVHFHQGKHNTSIIVQRHGYAASLYKFRDENCSNAQLLSGTPLHNNLSDLASIIRLIAPVGGKAPCNATKIKQSDRRWWDLEIWNLCSKAEIEKSKKQEWIKEMTKHFMFTLILDDDISSQPNLPPCTELKRIVPLTESQRARTLQLYTEAHELCRGYSAEAEAATTEEDFDERSGGGNGLDIYAKLLRLRQVANCSFLPEYKTLFHEPEYKLDIVECVNLHSNKLKALVSDIKEDLKLSPNDSIVITTFWYYNLELIRAALEYYFPGQEPLIFHGGMKHSECESVLKTFREKQPQHRILIATLTKVAVGLDLTVANKLKIFEPFYNIALEMQLIKRLHRPPQMKPVLVVRYLSDGDSTVRSVDLFIRELQLYKIRNVLEMVQLSQRIPEGVETLSSQQQRELFTTETGKELEKWDTKARPTFRIILGLFKQAGVKRKFQC